LGQRCQPYTHSAELFWRLCIVCGAEGSSLWPMGLAQLFRFGQLIPSVRQRALGHVCVWLKPGSASWSYKCMLFIDAKQQMQAAPSASKPVRLVVDPLVCKISKPKNKAEFQVVPYDIEVW